MKTRGKVLLATLSAAMLVTASVMGTLAYLQDTTETVKNTFTVGKVVIDLDEADVDEYGKLLYKATEGDATAAVLADRVKANEYKLIPGHNYIKDPTVHVDDESEDAYLFVKVVNGIADIEADPTIDDQIEAKGWIALPGVDDVFYKEFDKDAEEPVYDYVVFEEFTVSGTADVEDYTDDTIEITAYAVQADGFDSAAEAWDAADFE